MDVILVVMLAFLGVLAPDSTKEFTLDMRGEIMVFEKQADNIWQAKDIGKFKIDGLSVGIEQNGKFISVNISKVLGVSSVKELKTLSKFTLGSKVAKIQMQENGFTLNLQKGAEFNVSWK